jgi:hypothetical protein
MKAVYFPEMSVHFYWTSRRHAPKHNILDSLRCENVKSKKAILVFIILYIKILWHINPMLGDDRETNN